MAYDEQLADRIRTVIGTDPASDEKKMFGGICFFWNGNMACGVHKDHLIVRLGVDAKSAVIDQAYVAEFDITGRPMKAWVMVSPPAFEEDGDLKDWVEKGLTFARTLPPK